MNIIKSTVEIRKEIANKLRDELLAIMSDEPKSLQEWANDIHISIHTLIYFLKGSKVTSNIILKRIQIFINKKNL